MHADMTYADTACMPCHNPTAQVQSYNYSNVVEGAEARAQLSAFVGSPVSPAPPSPLLVMAALPGGASCRRCWMTGWLSS